MKTPVKFDDSKMEALLTAYKSEKRLMIRNLLAIYKELSLTELADHMHMSKTAVHHHLKILRDLKIVEVAREEEARGSIDRKYFQLVKGAWRFSVEDLNLIEDPVRRYEMMKMMIQTLQMVYQEATHRIELMVNFTQYLGDELNQMDETNLDSNELNNLQTKLVDNNTHLINMPLGKQQYLKYLELREEFVTKVNQMKRKTDDENSPYLAVLLDMPIKSLLDFNIKEM